MPRRKTVEEDVELRDDEVLVAPTEDDPSADEGITPLVEGAPVSAAARHNARYADA